LIPRVHPDHSSPHNPSSRPWRDVQIKIGSVQSTEELERTDITSLIDSIVDLQTSKRV
jgi:hypothetical protein